MTEATKPGKCLVIGNPAAGGGKGERLTHELVTALTRVGCHAETLMTGYAGDARIRVRDRASGMDTLAIVGGDGTINEVLNGLPDPSRTPIAILPTGTANILARELSLPSKPEVVARIIAEGCIRRLDMGLIGEHRFLMVASAGFDALVTEEVRRRRTGSLGYRRYLVPILTVLFRYRAPKLNVSVDGGESVQGGFVVVSNTRNYGGFFSFADRARCDSGHLDVCVFPRGALSALAQYYIAALRGRVSRDTDVRYLVGRHIVVDSEEPVMIEVDGDPLGTTPMEIRLVPSHVPIHVPPGGTARRN
jgi:YegS/Rv2252/BmrU family lipid kinase